MDTWPQPPSQKTPPAPWRGVGRWNGFLGRVLLLAGFAWGAWLDPWSLSERDPAALPGSARMAARQAQAVVIGAAFLQVIAAAALAVGGPRAGFRPVAAGLTGLGTVLYTAGYALAASFPGAVRLIPAGAALNLGGFALLLAAAWKEPGASVWRVVLPVICLGMLLDVAMGLFAADPARFLPASLGPDDGVRLRMLRLARAAALALPAVALLYEGLAVRAHGPLVRRGRAALWCGVLGMSSILTAAGFTSVQVKFLLPLPALTTFAGTCAGLWLARTQGRPLEVWGWLLVAASMGAGLLMGLYAFDGPLPAPDFLGHYNDFARRLSRLAHAYCIVLGLVSIFLARELHREDPLRGLRRLGVPLLVVGGALTVILIGVEAAFGLPTGLLAPGPALVALALALCLGPDLVRP
jgi:hypothetical protein